MEIPTNHHNDIDRATEIIAAQAKEIEELQLVIVRLRDELQGADRELRMLGNELNKMEGA
mgnify:CR=1 FL=1